MSTPAGLRARCFAAEQPAAHFVVAAASVEREQRGAARAVLGRPLRYTASMKLDPSVNDT